MQKPDTLRTTYSHNLIESFLLSLLSLSHTWRYWI